MGVFDDVKITWQGRTYVIPANQVLGAIARVEEVISLRDLVEATNGRDMQFARTSQAFGAVLRYAGATVDDDEVYAGMLSGGDAVAASLAALNLLLALMLPPTIVGGDEQPKESVRGNRGAPTSSAKSTKRR